MSHASKRERHIQVAMLAAGLFVVCGFAMSGASEDDIFQTPRPAVPQCDPVCEAPNICVLWGGKQSRCIARCDEQARICPDDRLRCLPLTLPPENIVGYFCLE